MADWRLAKSLQRFRVELKQLYPNRDTRSDGSIADGKHSGTSKHQPGPDGIVEAVDVDEDIDGIDGGNDSELWSLAEHVRKLGDVGHPALKAGAHIIYEGRIWSYNRRSEGWRAYTGSNAHRHHLHLACSDGAGKDSLSTWHLDRLRPAARKPDRWLGLSDPPMVGNDVRGVHDALIKISPNNKGLLAPDYDLKRYGRASADVVAVFQRHRSIDERGCGPLTWAALRKEVHG